MPHDKPGYDYRDDIGDTHDDTHMIEPFTPAPVEYRYMVQEHPAARHSRQPDAWICPQCLANRIMSHGAVIIVSVIHTDPARPRPTCADCEAREAAEARVKAKLNPVPDALADRINAKRNQENTP